MANAIRVSSIQATCEQPVIPACLCVCQTHSCYARLCLTTLQQNLLPSSCFGVGNFVSQDFVVFLHMCLVCLEVLQRIAEICGDDESTQQVLRQVSDPGSHNFLIWCFESLWRVTTALKWHVAHMKIGRS